MLDLAVIVVNWNTRNLLKKCLESVAAETKDIASEIFVVDNASTDGSVEMVRREFPQVRLITNTKNLGFAKANNQAIKLTHSRYVLLLNPDTVVLGGCFRSMLVFMDDHPEAGAAGGKILNPKGEVDYFRSAKKFPTPLTKFFVDISLDRLFPWVKTFGRYSLSGWNRENAREVDVLSGAFMFVRKEAITDVGMLDEDYFILAEDADWCYRIKKKGWKILFNPEARIIHFAGESIDRVKITRLRYAISSNLLYFQKHHGRLAGLEFRVLMSLTNFLRAMKWTLRFIFCKNRKISWDNIRSHLQAVFLCYTIGPGWKKD